ncbi:hypothetical protein C7447_102688 [Tenacibaculum adriaticum]|uniref:Alpha-ketoglutarate decarboxylase n=1 Tax=Tenacibaculum adriaticum TaxID=413713 RepID=A0A5S5DWC3_9FLAO|nr:alpha-ketoglutarate decarboxylase [Tenacibaculum adriaticum]TYP99366.1 hypothetical protein C7447_102688 [Tenacibaculum adriaticum]
MKKIFTLLFLITFSTIVGQEKQSDFWENVRFGGGIGLGFGNNNTTIAVSPTAVYDFNEQFSLGVSLGYIYNKRGDYKSNVFSGSLLSLYRPYTNIEFSGEFEQLFVNQKFAIATDNYNYPALYLGAAYRTRNVSFGLRYDVLYNENKSIYTSAVSPIIRIFF